MQINLSDLAAGHPPISPIQQPSDGARNRLRPSLFQYDYLVLSALAADIRRLISEIPTPSQERAVALDVGCGNSPYRELLEARGFRLSTLDVHHEPAPDFFGTVEEAAVPDDYADLVLCTQVLEHSLDPKRGMNNMFRILRPGGYLIASVPHIWFYHPHPADNWRFTQEGLIRLAETTGFKPIRLLSQGGSALSYFQISNMFLCALLGRVGAPIYAVSNLIGTLCDILVRDGRFCMNFALLARKPCIMA